MDALDDLKLRPELSQTGEQFFKILCLFIYREYSVSYVGNTQRRFDTGLTALIKYSTTIWNRFGAVIEYSATI
jgi:hypothetical protein